MITKDTFLCWRLIPKAKDPNGYFASNRVILDLPGVPVETLGNYVKSAQEVGYEISSVHIG